MLVRMVTGWVAGEEQQQHQVLGPTHWLPACRISCSGSEATVGSLGPSLAQPSLAWLSQGERTLTAREGEAVAEIETQIYFLQTISNIVSTNNTGSLRPSDLVLPISLDSEE